MSQQPQGELEKKLLSNVIVELTPWEVSLLEIALEAQIDTLSKTTIVMSYSSQFRKRVNMLEQYQDLLRKIGFANVANKRASDERRFRP